MAASKLAQQAKASYEAYIGYCYGKKKDSGRGKPKIYQELAGKNFWWRLTGEEDFYIKLIEYMGDLPEKYVARFQESYFISNEFKLKKQYLMENETKLRLKIQSSRPIHKALFLPCGITYIRKHSSKILILKSVISSYRHHKIISFYA